MEIYTLKNVLEKELYIACVNYIKLIKSDLNDEKIYGFSIYSYGYDQGIYVAVSTTDSLLRHKEKFTNLEFQVPNEYLEICADEWKYIGFHSEAFGSISKYLIKLYNILYEGCQFDDETDYKKAEDYILYVIPEVMVQVLLKLKKDQFFDDESFIKDVFLGYQFSDAGERQIEMYVQASKRLNSSFWHKKLLKYQEYCLSQNC